MVEMCVRLSVVALICSPSLFPANQWPALVPSQTTTLGPLEERR